MVDATTFGLTDDPYLQAAQEVAPYRHLSPQECWTHFVDLMKFTDVLMRARPAQEWPRWLKIHDGLDDAGRWWERVPAP